jgi:hypothetical protein
MPLRTSTRLRATYICVSHAYLHARRLHEFAPHMHISTPDCCAHSRPACVRPPAAFFDVMHAYLYAILLRAFTLSLRTSTPSCHVHPRRACILLCPLPHTFMLCMLTSPFTSSRAYLITFMTIFHIVACVHPFLCHVLSHPSRIFSRLLLPAFTCILTSLRVRSRYPLHLCTLGCVPSRTLMPFPLPSHHSIYFYIYTFTLPLMYLHTLHQILPFKFQCTKSSVFKFHSCITVLSSRHPSPNHHHYT